MREIVFFPAAENDISDIWDYSADRWGADQANSYTDEIRDACYGIARRAKQGSSSVLPDFQKYLCGSHVIYFFADEDYLNIIRILHQRQDVERHLLRREV